jgi:hypothetical protein
MRRQPLNTVSPCQAMTNQQLHQANQRLQTNLSLTAANLRAIESDEQRKPDMICTSCYFINPSENVFCQNCGAHLPHVQNQKPSISPLILANTLDNSSLLISRGPWQMRMDLMTPFLWLAVIVFVFTLNNTYALGILAVRVGICAL